MTKGTAAFLECVDAGITITPNRVLTREGLLSTAKPELKQWIEWAEPGEAYQSRRDRVLYLCVQLTMGD